MNLDGKVFLVTGGSRGIGRSIVEEAANAGAKVAFCYASNEAAANEVVERLQSGGKEVLALKADVSNSEDVASLIDQVVKSFGRIDVLVNNAGISRDNLLMRASEEDWNQTHDINLKGSFLMSKAVSRIMMKQRFGRMIFVSSVVGQMGNKGQAIYSASKAGQIGFMKSLAKELASRNITCNAIAPGFIETEMTDTMTDDARKAISSQIPVGRIGSAKDVADAVVFLASDFANYITGHVLSVNGGLYL
jgi:3-oxoacyl-[acyl-carrier protein] reductase